MTKIYCAIIALIFICIPATLFAGEPVTGKWSGTCTIGDEDYITVKYTVEKLEDGGDAVYQIMVFIHDEAYLFKDLKISDGTVKFILNPGEDLNCTLKEDENGMYSGICKDPKDKGNIPVLKLVMNPPKEEENE